MLGIIPAVGMPIATALEARGEFRANFGVAIAGAVVILGGVGLTYRYESATPALQSLVAAAAVQTLLWILLGHRHDLLRVADFLKSIRAVALIQGGITLTMLGLSNSIGPENPATQFAWVAMVSSL